VSIATPICSAENLDIPAAQLDCMGDSCALVLLPGLNRLVISAIFKPPPFFKIQLSNATNVQSTSIMELHELKPVRKRMFNNLINIQESAVLSDGFFCNDVHLMISGIRIVARDGLEKCYCKAKKCRYYAKKY
jgi:hypothetical protein